MVLSPDNVETVKNGEIEFNCLNDVVEEEDKEDDDDYLQPYLFSDSDDNSFKMSHFHS